MTLAELRKDRGLTQKEAASLLAIPYRTYIRYEENELYKDNYKYRMIFTELDNATRIDEEHGLLSTNKIKTLLVPILQKHNIAYCYLFGSYAKGTANERSDIDLLVDTDITGLGFFNLVEEIRNTLHKRIDMIRLSDLKNNNPIALEILREGIKIL